MPSNHLILCHPLLLLPSILPSIRVFSNESALCIMCQSTGASASASVLPMNIQDWFCLGLNGLISLQSKGLSRVFSNTTVQKHQSKMVVKRNNSKCYWKIICYLVHSWPFGSTPIHPSKPSLVVVQSLTVSDFGTPWTAACQASLFFSISWSLLKLTSIESVMPSSHLILLSPFSSCPQSFPASGSVPMSQFFVSCGQSIGASVSASVLSTNIQSWFPLGLTGLISLLPKGLSRVFSNITLWKHQLFGTQPSLWSNSHIHTWLLGKPIALTSRTSVSKVMSLLFNVLSRFVIAPFLPRSKRLLISWLQSPSTVILELKKTKSP